MQILLFEMLFSVQARDNETFKSVIFLLRENRKKRSISKTKKIARIENLKR